MKSPYQVLGETFFRQCFFLRWCFRFIFYGIDISDCILFMHWSYFGIVISRSLSAEGGVTQLTIGMAGFGFALALPFGLLALFPSFLKSIPKSGGWMTKVKVTLGFLELALALKFLSNADLVAHWGILKREVFMAIWLIISLLFIYLMGWMHFPHDLKDNKTNKLQYFFAFLVFLFSIYLIQGLGKNQTGQLTLLSGFLPYIL